MNYKKEKKRLAHQYKKLKENISSKQSHYIDETESRTQRERQKLNYMSIDLRNNSKNKNEQKGMQTPIDIISNRNLKRAETSKKCNRPSIQQQKKICSKFQDYPNQSWIIQGKYIDFGDSNSKSVGYFQNIKL